MENWNAPLRVIGLYPMSEEMRLAQGARRVETAHVIEHRLAAARFQREAQRAVLGVGLQLQQRHFLGRCALERFDQAGPRHRQALHDRFGGFHLGVQALLRIARGFALGAEHAGGLRAAAAPVACRGIACRTADAERDAEDECAEPAAGAAPPDSRARAGAVSCGEALQPPTRGVVRHRRRGIEEHEIGQVAADAVALTLENREPFAARVLHRLPACRGVQRDAHAIGVRAHDPGAARRHRAARD